MEYGYVHGIEVDISNGSPYVWVLHLTNFDMCWHFDTYEKALAEGRSTGFEFTISRVYL